ncbi:MAG TPA: hypothetical protein VF282_11560 [Bacillota bacterium]
MEVLALVGPAGTGKSHRAIVVAHDHQVDVIIDDGLLIQGSRILAGRSAKREATTVAAVRRAIFADPLHREEMRSALRRINPGRVLILGTSREMVLRIARALDLPEPSRYIGIHEVATPEEIRQARRVRRQHGKHVIPAPTFEVKKSFSGYLIDPLRIFYRPRHARQDVLVEKSTVRPTFSSLGHFFIAEHVVAAIATRAVSAVDGVDGVVRVRVESDPDGVVLVIDVAVRYGAALHRVLRHAQREAVRMVEHMTALHVRRVDVVARRVTFAGEAGPVDGAGDPAAAHAARDAGGGFD